MKIKKNKSNVSEAKTNKADVVCFEFHCGKARSVGIADACGALPDRKSRALGSGDVFFSVHPAVMTRKSYDCSSSEANRGSMSLIVY